MIVFNQDNADPGQKPGKSTFVRIPVLVCALTLATLSGTATAQNALGDGRGLDANTRVGSGGRNMTRPSLEQEVQFRNAIATGNAPGGLSFRGDLGYSAPGEFQGELGSDALYSFRRDSLYSGLAGMGIRGTDAVQYQFAMTTGSQPTRGLTGNLAISRLGGSLVSDRTKTITSGFGSDPTLSYDSSSSRATGTLRSTSSYTASSSLTPELVVTYQSGLEKSEYGIVASPLMGLVPTPMDTIARRKTLGEKPPQPAKTSYDEVITNIRNRAKELREDAAEKALEEGGTPDPTTNDPQATDMWIQERIMKLQRQVLGLPAPKSADDPVEVIQQDDTTPDSPVKMIDPTNPSGNDESTEQQPLTFGRGDGAALQGTNYQIDPDTLKLIKGGDKKVTFLVDPTAGDRDFYVQHMLAGEQLLKDGRYFDAEERFTAALSIRIGDVSAQLGRLHAQIGAGLVMSGSVNLQTLMSEHLEIVSRRYSGELLPSEERIRVLIELLRERAGLDEIASHKVPESPKIKVACGLLISYLGYQIGDEQQMQDGFSVVKQIGTDSDIRLVKLLEAVWSAPAEIPATPTQDDQASEQTP